MTNLTNQRQVFVEEYVRSGNHLGADSQSHQKPWRYLPKRNGTENQTP